MPALRQNFLLERRLMVSLFKLGSWMTVSNLLAPALSYVDRFLIGGLVSLTAVAFYTAPFDMLTRLAVIPAAMITVLFP
ncbi:oligosaccharide flippase family protein, partial [Salmonella sp. SAL04286]|uniref:oligosaccharide flippase family protein n=1 Tax=Salmonella sp. SAL04286 TaxID=3159864 RepID=UPI00397DCABD